MSHNNKTAIIRGAADFHGSQGMGRVFQASLEVTHFDRIWTKHLLKWKMPSSGEKRIAEVISRAMTYFHDFLRIPA